ncbi:MAG: hypothetical protein RL885_07690 [Planctomycetota bacterium]
MRVSRPGVALTIVGVALVLGASLFSMPFLSAPEEGEAQCRSDWKPPSPRAAELGGLSRSHPRAQVREDAVEELTTTERGTSSPSGLGEGSPQPDDEADLLDSIIQMTVGELAESELVNPHGIELSKQEQTWLQNLIDQDLVHVNSIWGQRMKRSHEVFREIRDLGEFEVVQGHPSAERPSPTAPGQLTAYSFKNGVLMSVRVDRGRFPDLDRLVDSEREAKQMFFNDVSAFFLAPHDPGPSPIEPEQRNRGFVMGR